MVYAMRYFGWVLPYLFCALTASAQNFVDGSTGQVATDVTRSGAGFSYGYVDSSNMPQTGYIDGGALLAALDNAALANFLATQCGQPSMSLATSLFGSCAATDTQCRDAQELAAVGSNMGSQCEPYFSSPYNIRYDEADCTASSYNNGTSYGVNYIFGVNWDSGQQTAVPQGCTLSRSAVGARWHKNQTFPWGYNQLYFTSETLECPVAGTDCQGVIDNALAGLFNPAINSIVAGEILATLTDGQDVFNPIDFGDALDCGVAEYCVGSSGGGVQPSDGSGLPLADDETDGTVGGDPDTDNPDGTPTDETDTGSETPTEEPCDPMFETCEPDPQPADEFDGNDIDLSFFPDDLQREEIRLPTLETSGPAPTGGSCPSPRVIEVYGASFQISFEPLCQAADFMKPIILFFSALTAFRIAFGGSVA